MISDELTSTDFQSKLLTWIFLKISLMIFLKKKNLSHCFLDKKKKKRKEKRK